MRKSQKRVLTAVGIAVGVGGVLFLFAKSATKPAVASAPTGMGAAPSRLEAVGRATWIDLHARAKLLRPGEGDAFERYMRDRIRALPCGRCVAHGLAYLDELKPDFSTREKAVRYLCMFHNEVNRHLGKPIVDCSTL